MGCVLLAMAWRKFSRMAWWPLMSVTAAEEALWLESPVEMAARSAGGLRKNAVMMGACSRITSASVSGIFLWRGEPGDAGGGGGGGRPGPPAASRGGKGGV